MKAHVVFVDDLIVNFFTNYTTGGETFQKKASANMATVVQFQIHHGVIWIPKEIFLKCMIKAETLDAIVRIKYFSRLNNFNLTVVDLKYTMQKFFFGSQRTRDGNLQPALNVASPYTGPVVSAKTKNPKVVQATTNILKSISLGKLSSLLDTLGNGSRL